MLSRAPSLLQELVKTDFSPRNVLVCIYIVFWQYFVLQALIYINISSGVPPCYPISQIVQTLLCKNIYLP